MKRALKIFKSISDRNRLRILKILQYKNSICVCEISEILGVGQPTVSRHLKILEDAGFIVAIKDGKWVNYSICNDNNDEKIASILSNIEKWLKNDPQVKNDIEKVDSTDRSVLCSK